MPKDRTASGLLVLDKPVGESSRQTLNRITRLFRGVKMGHAGTLDPMASGVLVVCLGKATRLIRYVQRMSKEYRAVLRLGERSSTHDLESQTVAAAFQGEIDAAGLEQSLAKFQGDIQQVPPQHSAVHLAGKRAYELARRAQSVSMEPRPVRVHRLVCTRFDYPVVDLEVTCSSGTYVRSLARDLGEDLGCGAVLTELVRTAVGPFLLKDAVQADLLDPRSVWDRVLPPRAAVSNLPSVVVPEHCRLDVAHGRAIPDPEQNEPTAGAAAEVALYDHAGELLAVASRDPAAGLLYPHIVLMAQESETRGSARDDGTAVP